MIRLTQRLAMPARALGAMIGRVTRRNRLKPPMPKARAASIWPEGMAWMAPRKISEA
ncbi:hypothetical protein D3C77_787070 [compost metagenome]